jgi:cystathionine beta-synthase
MTYLESILDAIGNTPLVRLRRMAEKDGVKARVLAKLEGMNPGGSIKDRIGVTLIEAAERDGKLKPGGLIVEPTSGNTGIGLAIAAGIKGYKLVCTMNDKQSQEKRDLLKAYGAEVIICPTNVPAGDPQHYQVVAERIAQERGAFRPNQYDNLVNRETHYKTTGPEIWRQTAGCVDVFVAGLGTCGTITGIAKYLKERNPKVTVVGVDTAGSILKDVFRKRPPKEPVPWKLEGIGNDQVPGNLDYKYIDDVITVKDKDAFLTCRRLLAEERIFAGGSSGAAVAGALRKARRLTSDKMVVALLPDAGNRYLSKIYNDDWMRQNGYLA